MKEGKDPLPNSLDSEMSQGAYYTYIVARICLIAGQAVKALNNDTSGFSGVFFRALCDVRASVECGEHHGKVF